MMKVLVVLAIVCLAAADARRPGGRPGGFGRPRPNPELRACFEVLMPKSEREEVKQVIETCVDENDLRELIENQGRRGRRESYDQILEDAGYTTEALKLRTCVANALGFVAADGTFDEAGFKASLQEKASGTEQEESIGVALEFCSTEGFDEFKVGGFLKCVINTCAAEEEVEE